MIGARGCVSRNTADPRIIHVSVAWQGLTGTSEPTVNDCGAGLYGTEAQRRVVTRTLFFADALD
jgi:hypothetical protein